MEKTYREIGLETYGHKCELCGYSIVEVHHINYQLHDQWEKKIRDMVKSHQDVADLLEMAKGLGFLDWDGHDLAKDNRSTNLSVLCGNCHSLIHLLDAGMKLLNALTPRK